MANVLGFAGLGVGAGAFLFAVLALALPYWTTQDSTLEVNAGLWRYCAKNSAGRELCGDPIDDLIDDDTEKTKLRATRAMVILGFICTVGALAPFALFLFIMKDKKILGFIGAGVNFAAGIFLMIGMAIYVDTFDEDNVDLGAAFALDIVAWIAAWIAGALMAVGAMKGDAAA